MVNFARGILQHHQFVLQEHVLQLPRQTQMLIAILGFQVVIKIQLLLAQLSL